MRGIATCVAMKGGTFAAWIAATSVSAAGPRAGSTRGQVLHFVQLFFNFLFLAEPPIHFRELLLLPEITFRMRITGKFQKFIEIRKSR